MFHIFSIKTFKNFFLIFIFFFTISCNANYNLKKYYISNTNNISNEQKLRLSNYLAGEFYSFELKKPVFGYPIAFLITEDGSRSIILACYSQFDECHTDIEIYQLIKKYEKKLQQDILIMGLGKKILKNQNPYPKIIKNNKNKFVKKNNDIFHDKLIVPADSCGGDDC